MYRYSECFSWERILYVIIVIVITIITTTNTVTMKYRSIPYQAKLSSSSSFSSFIHPHILSHSQRTTLNPSNAFTNFVASSLFSIHSTFDILQSRFPSLFFTFFFHSFLDSFSLSLGSRLSCTVSNAGVSVSKLKELDSSKSGTFEH